MHRTTRRIAWAAAAALLLVPGPASPCSTTGCVLVARGEAGTLAAGTWRLDTTFRYADMDRGLYGHDPVHVFGNPDPPTLRPLVDDATGRLRNNYHKERALTARVFQADLSRGITSRLTLVLSVPAFTERRVQHDVFPGAADPDHEETPEGARAMRLETAGIGDVQLNARYILRRGLVGSLGVQLPTGDDDRVDEYGLRADPMLQPGTGALAIVGGLSMAGMFPAIGGTWSVAATYQRSTESARGYRFGDDAYALATVARPVAGPFGAAFTLKAQATRRSTFHGEPSASTGGQAVYAAPSLRWRGPGGVGVFATVQAPLYQHVNEGQLGARVIVSAGLSMVR